MTPQPSTDRNLLFGILALQMDFIGRDALIQAMSAWTLAKHKPLGQILHEHGALAPAEREVLEALVEKHLEHHGNDPRRSLAAAATPSAVHPVLSAIRDDDVQASMSSLFSTPDTELEVSTVNEVRTGAVRYEILRPHAKGGLGEVFVALDRELQREVALKEIRKERADEVHSRGRFLLEAEITGGLEHPGVVPVYGLGQYADGRLFYAMRLIKGETLKDAIERYHQAADQARSHSRELELRTLLTRFVAVCNTVAYAHSRGVLHRDLKPANIMLGKYGETLVIDWGLAKSIGRQDPDAAMEELTLRPSSGSNLAATQAGAAVGTPAYMSPEQAGGKWDLVGPASDIYSLGATLYTLLTGAVPVRGADPADVLQKVQRGDYPPPRQLNPIVPPALEAVCLRAMALSPGGRYATALEIAAEVERWLADEPVQAWLEPTLARMGRWIRRHRTGVAGAVTAITVAALCLGASTGLLLAAYAEAHHQRDLAREQRDKAAGRFQMAREAVDKFYVRVSNSDELKAHGLENLRKKLLRSAGDFYERLVQEEDADPEVRAEQGRAYWRLAVLSASMGDLDLARQKDDVALAIFEQLAREFPENRNYQFDIALSHSNIAMQLRERGRMKDAEAEWTKTKEMLVALREAYPNEVEYQSKLATCLTNLGSLAYMTGKPDRAEAFYKDVLPLSRSLAAAQPQNLEHQKDLGEAYGNLGLIYTALGKNKESEQAFKETISTLQPVWEKDRNDPDIQLALARAHNNLGNLYTVMARPDAARDEFAAGRDLQEQLVARHPLILEYQRDLAISHYNLGDANADLGRPDLAGKFYSEAQTRIERLLQIEPASLEYQAMLGGAQSSQAILLEEAGSLAEALQQYEKAFDTLKAVLTKDPQQVWAKQFYTDALLARAQVWSKRGDHTAADRDLAEAVKQGQAPEEAKYRMAHAGVLARGGKVKEALAEADAAAKETALTGRALYLLASVYAQCASLTKEDASLAKRAESGAVAALGRARSEGYFQFTLMVDRLKHDSDFATLRKDEEFRKFLAAIEPGKPPAK